ncbi:hypothetical protein [Solibacillus sp. NPDC093137]|uniref:hypothetical protein n=1 Tax=Solibacillus sp. NPDC093137 TaxID=3390678 RepID=UPI003D001956
MEEKQYNAPQFCEDIAEHLLKGEYIDYEQVETYYFIDNNTLTDLAALAKRHPVEFHTLIQHLMNIGSPVAFILTEVIFEESISNVKNKHHFNALYKSFYNELGAIAPVYIVTMQENFDQFEVLDGDFETMFPQDKYIDFAKHLNSNPGISTLLNAATTISDVDSAYRSVREDAGERMAFLYIHAMLASRKKTVRFLSNEDKGVYGKWCQVYSEDATLHSMVDIADEDEYIQLFRVESYHKVLYDYVSTLTEQDRKDFLSKARQGDLLNYPVRYTEKTVIKYKGITNEKFNDIVMDGNSTIYH